MGFTLVEMMVVTVIFSVISVVIGASFFSGLKLWDRAKNSDFVYNNGLLTLEIFAKELRQSIKSGVIAFEGEEDRLSFPTLKGNSIVKITYLFNSQKNLLLRKQVKIRDILDNREDSAIEREVLSLNGFFLSYFYFDQDKEEYLWINSWDKEGIFKAVKIEAIINGIQVSKTIFIPVA